MNSLSAGLIAETEPELETNQIAVNEDGLTPPTEEVILAKPERPRQDPANMPQGYALMLPFQF